MILRVGLIPQRLLRYRAGATKQSCGWPCAPWRALCRQFSVAARRQLRATLLQNGTESDVSAGALFAPLPPSLPLSLSVGMAQAKGPVREIASLLGAQDGTLRSLPVASWAG